MTLHHIRLGIRLPARDVNRDFPAGKFPVDGNPRNPEYRRRFIDGEESRHIHELLLLTRQQNTGAILLAAYK
jgi:hypothetical protein